MKQRRAGLAVITVLTLALAGNAILGAGAASGSRPGTLDPSFGSGGRAFAKAPPFPSESAFGSMLRQADGALLIESSWNSPYPQSPTRSVERRLPDGKLDPSFGKNGRVLVPRGEGMAIRADGGVLVGVEDCGEKRNALILIDSHGVKIGDFGRGGCSQPLPFTPERLAVGEDGSIFVAGTTVICPCGKSSPRRKESYLAKVRPDGRRDPSFGSRGLVRLRSVGVEAEAGEETPRAIVPAADGGLLVAVEATVVRLTAAGQPDPNFGTEGKVELRASSHEGPIPLRVNGMLQLPGGQLLIASTMSKYGFQESEGKIVVDRLLANGSLDPSFGTGGTTEIATRAPAAAKAVAAIPGGSALVLGTLREEACRRICAPILISVGPSGALNSSYGHGGVAELPPLPYGSAFGISALVTAPDGAAIVAGWSETATAYALTPAGASDRRFGESGTVVGRHFEPAILGPTSLVPRPGGGYTVAAKGSAGTAQTRSFLLGFGEDGRQDRGATGFVPSEASGNAVAGSHRSTIFWSAGKPALWAVRPDGRRLLGYGEDGVAKVPKDFRLLGVRTSPNGGTMVFGATKGGRAMGVYRLDAKGHPLAGFGHRGLAQVAFGHREAGALAALVQPDGKVVVTGWVDDRVGATRLLPNGRLDHSFGHRGRVSSLLRHHTYANLIAPFGDGVVIAGRTKRGPAALAGIIRLDGRGHLVPGFGRDGVVHPPKVLPALALFTGGSRIVFVAKLGNVTVEPGASGVELRAYNRDGSAVRAFGHSGRVLAATSRKATFSPRAAIQQPDGAVVVAGLAESTRSKEPKRVELLRFRE